VIAALGIAVLHSFWQAALVAAAVELLVRRNESALERYRVVAGALTLTCMLLVGTLAIGLRPAQIADTDAFTMITPVMQRTLFAFPSLFECIGAVCAIGALFNLSRYAGGWILARRWYVGEARKADDHWRQRVQRIAVRHAFAVPRVMQSDVIHSPAVFGLRSPAIVLPTRGLAELDEAQLDAIVAHELTHIARRDGLANALQCIVDAVLFFNPFVRALSRRARTEREHICDTQAVTLCAPRSYVSALLTLEETRSRRFALPANGSDLVERVRVLLRPPPMSTPSAAACISAIAVVLLAVLSSFVIPARLHAVTQQIAGIMRYTVTAVDPRGSFTVSINRGRAVHATLDGRAVATERIVQHGDSIIILDLRGTRELALRLSPSGGFTWQPRRPISLHH
jgi:beta-lactamase regulating signal transducer with metallopeptidase domain